MNAGRTIAVVVRPAVNLADLLDSSARRMAVELGGRRSQA